ncbi:MAG: DNA repair protein RadA [Gammaproteobacteria bacterium]|nr:DNA repair protein RadA [Gammaproteobacteria bacterium]
MSKAKLNYVCRECGASHPKWSGQCSECGEWNTLEELAKPTKTASANYAGERSEIVALSQVKFDQTARAAIGIGELDRVLGGGLVAGSISLIGGDPGIGKSTLLLQAVGKIAQSGAVLYVTGEESLQQVALRAQRINVTANDLKLMAETQVEAICAAISIHKPTVCVVDSIQTIHTEAVSAAPGAVSQVRESAARLVRIAKQTGTAIFLVGHVTKEGAIAGPRVLEHMVDTVLSFESADNSRFRMLRTIKNRFGAVNELGVFAMDDTGLKEVTNPSAIFLSRHSQPISGSIVTAALEGSRPILLELQVLVEMSHTAQARRLAVGFDPQRLAMLLAVLHRHAGIAMFDQDVYVNAVGGVRIHETAADLPILLAAVSSLRDRPLPSGLLCFGEVGLAGEVRPVPEGEQRIKEAASQGFTRLIIPKANRIKKAPNGVELISVERIDEAMDAIR